jgi:hypothetical protein
MQDEEWQKRNRDAINSIAVGFSARRTQQAVAAAQRELADLAAYHRPTGRDDSVLGNWFFIEKFKISSIHSNVTISLSSNIMAKAQLLKVQVCAVLVPFITAFSCNCYYLCQIHRYGVLNKWCIEQHCSQSQEHSQLRVLNEEFFGL